MLSETIFAIPFWFWALLALYLCVLPLLWVLYRKWLRRQDLKLGVYLSDYVHWKLGANQSVARAKKLAAISSKTKLRTFKAKEKSAGKKKTPTTTAAVSASMGWGISKRKAFFIKGVGPMVRPLGGAGKFVEQLAVQSQSVKALSSDQIWPQGDHMVEPLEIERYKLEQQAERLSESFRSEFETAEVSCAVQHRGRLLWEAYAEGMEPETPQVCKAITPFVFATVFGLLAQQRRLGLEQEIPEDGWVKDARERILFSHLLKSTSGLAAISEKNLHQAIYGSGRGLYGLVSELSTTGKVGAAWKNSPSNILGLSYLLSLGFGERADIYRAFVRKNLFRVLSMHNSSMALTPDGFIQSYSGLTSTPRDLLRFASLYQNDGFWLGERLLDRSWIDFVFDPVEQSGAHGASVYSQLNTGAKEHKILKARQKLHRHGPPYASLPQDSLFVLRDGQSLLVIIPSAKLSISLISTGSPLSDDGIENFVHTALMLVQLDTSKDVPEEMPEEMPEVGSEAGQDWVEEVETVVDENLDSREPEINEQQN